MTASRHLVCIPGPDGAPRSLRPAKAIACLAGLIVLMALPLAAQNQRKAERRGLPEDWSHHHVVFGVGARTTTAVARAVVSDPRFLHQEWRRLARRRRGGQHHPDPRKHRVDWSVNLGGTGSRLAAGTFPAKYTFNINASPDCSNDFVVYGLNIAGSASQATIVAYNNLYTGTPSGLCPGTAPTVKWAYNTGGAINTSPVLSLDGKKVAWVAGSGSPVLHVLTIGTSGTDNGTAANTPATPGVNNNAVDTTVSFGTIGDTRSSLFVDYSNDVGYAASDDGNIHKFTGIFTGTPAEVTTGGWPFHGQDAGNHVLTSVIYDSVSKNLFYGSDAGTLAYLRESGSTLGACATLGGTPPCLGLNSYSFAAPVVDAPLIDAAAQTVFVFSGSGVQQADTQLSTNGPQAKIGPAATIGASGASRSSNVVTITTTAAHGFSTGQRVTVAGVTNTSFNGTFVIASTPTTTTFTYAQTGSNASSGSGFAWTNLVGSVYAGAFDNNYYISPSSGFLYVCGNATSGTVAPTLFQIGFNSSNVMSSSTGGSTLALSSTASTNCSPMTEIFNPPTLKDWVFVSVGNGCTATGGGSAGCVMSLDVTSGFPVSATQGRPSTSGSSGIVVDNVSTSGQASSIYFSTQGDSVCGDGTTSGCAVKMTQSGLN